MTRNEISKIKLQSKDKILFLDEFVERYHHCHWIFDIKPERAFETIDQLTRWATKNKMQETLQKKCWFLLWQNRHQSVLNDNLPGLTFLARSHQCWQAGFSSLVGLPQLGNIQQAAYYAIPPRVGFLSLYEERIFKAYHKRKAHIISYLPEEEKDMRRAMELGCQHLLTNHPPLTY